ncbi:MAG: hypothetical protein V2A34_05065, partial [Lentisphaerota bacterium]
PQAAFDTDIETLGLPEHVYTILTEAEHSTVGGLMMAMKLNPDSVLGLPGIGPKAMQAIETALASATFPEPEKPAEMEADLVPEPESIETVVEVLPEAAIVPALEEAAVVAEEKAPAEEPVSGEEEKAFEKLFTLQNVLTQVPVAEDDEEGQGDKKDAKKKGRKDRVIEFDEERGEAVARKKHKRGDGVVEEEW